MVNDVMMYLGMSEHGLDESCEEHLDGVGGYSCQVFALCHDRAAIDRVGWDEMGFLVLKRSYPPSFHLRPSVQVVQ